MALKAVQTASWYTKMAERVGFEPTVPVRGHRFSRPAHSTALASLRASRRQADVATHCSTSHLGRQGPFALRQGSAHVHRMGRFQNRSHVNMRDPCPSEFPA